MFENWHKTFYLEPRLWRILRYEENRKDLLYKVEDLNLCKFVQIGKHIFRSFDDEYKKFSVF